MAEPKPIVFDNWQDGMKNHPVYGFGKLENIDIFENQGIAKIQNRFVDSGLVYTAFPGAEEYDKYGNTWTLTGGYGSSNGSLYKGILEVQSSIDDPWDIKVHKDYVLVSHAGSLAAYGPISSGPQYFDDILTGFSTLAQGTLLIGQDGYIYRCSGNTVYQISLTAAGSGVPPTAAIVTSLNLKDGQYATCIAELGYNVMIGTCGVEAYTDRYTLPVANIYPWNRQVGILGNAGLADFPVLLNESSVNAMVSHANKLYISAGQKGNIYVSDGVNYQQIASLPYKKYNYDTNSLVYVNAMSVHQGKTLLVGLSGSNSDVTNFGIYEIGLEGNKYPVALRKANDGSSGVTYFGFVNSKTDTVIRAGWWNGSSYAVDQTDGRVYSSYRGVIETQLVKTMSFYEKRSFQYIEWNLADALVSSQGLKIYYRTNTTADWTLNGTWTFSSVGPVSTFSDAFPVADTNFIQLKIELDQGTGLTSSNNLSLISVAIW